MANNTYGNIKGIGKVLIENPDGSEVIHKDVKYMPEVSRNLISYGMLEKSGCKYRGKGFKVQFYKAGRKVISGEYHEGLYYLQGKVTKAEMKVPREEKVGIEARKSGKGAEKSVKRAEKKKSRNVTFSKDLIQGPTPYGYKWQGSLAQGGGSSMTGMSGENESKVRREESRK